MPVEGEVNLRCGRERHHRDVRLVRAGTDVEPVQYIFHEEQRLFVVDRPYRSRLIENVNEVDRSIAHPGSLCLGEPHKNSERENAHDGEPGW